MTKICVFCTLLLSLILMCVALPAGGAAHLPQPGRLAIRQHLMLDPEPPRAPADRAASIVGDVEQTPVFVYDDIDEIGAAGVDPVTGLEHTAWGVYEDIMTPGTRIAWEIGQVTSPSRDGSALKCAITGGDQYNNIFCNSTIAKRWQGASWPYHAARRLVYSLWFYVDGTINCDQPNRSTIEGIEFGWQHTLIPVKHEFAVQWSKGGVWRYWDATTDPATGRPRAWRPFPRPIVHCFTDHAWHQIQFESYLLSDTSVYSVMRMDGVTYDGGAPSVGRVATPTVWHENFLQVSVQVNGNTALDGSRRVDPVQVYAEQIRLEGMPQPSDFLPRVQR